MFNKNFSKQWEQSKAQVAALNICYTDFCEHEQLLCHSVNIFISNIENADV